MFAIAPAKLTFAAAAAMALVMASPSSFAQSAQPPTLKSLNLSCGDFRHNQDSSWTPLHAITIGGVRLAGGAFKPGVAVADVDLAALLNKECLSHK